MEKENKYHQYVADELFKVLVKEDYDTHEENYTITFNDSYFDTPPRVIATSLNYPFAFLHINSNKKLSLMMKYKYGSRASDMNRIWEVLGKMVLNRMDEIPFRDF